MKIGAGRVLCVAEDAGPPLRPPRAPPRRGAGHQGDRLAWNPSPPGTGGGARGSRRGRGEGRGGGGRGVRGVKQKTWSPLSFLPPAAPPLWWMCISGGGRAATGVWAPELFLDTGRRGPPLPTPPHLCSGSRSESRVSSSTVGDPPHGVEVGRGCAWRLPPAVRECPPARPSYIYPVSQNDSQRKADISGGEKSLPAALELSQSFPALLLQTRLLILLAGLSCEE